MKKFLAIAMAAVLSLSLAACGGASSSTASSAAASSEAASTAASSEAASASATAYDYSSYTGETIDAIKAKGKLVLGTEAQYAPFEFKDLDANFVGCDIWLAQQLSLIHICPKPAQEPPPPPSHRVKAEERGREGCTRFWRRYP